MYWGDFEPARGGEIRKRRPAVIVSNDLANRQMNRVQVIPLTSATRRVYASEALVQLNGVPNKAVADQIRTVTKERILGYVGRLGTEDMIAVDGAIRVQLDLG